MFDFLLQMMHVISGNTVLAAFEPTVVLEHEAVVGAFKCLYWLIKHEIAHHTNYPALLQLANLLGCTYFDKLNVSFFCKCLPYFLFVLCDPYIDKKLEVSCQASFQFFRLAKAPTIDHTE